MSKPEGPTPPEGYRWVEEGEIVWPSDLIRGVSSLVPCAAKFEWRPAKAEFHFLRSKVTQPDLAWLKSKALDQAKLHSAGSVERERILCAVTEAVRAYSDALRALVPEREQWRPELNDSASAKWEAAATLVKKARADIAAKIAAKTERR